MNNELIDFIANTQQFVLDNLQHPNPTLTTSAKNNLFNLIKEFPYNNVDLRAITAENVDKMDADNGYLQYSTQELRDALMSLNDPNNIIYNLTKTLEGQLDEYADVMEDEENMEDTENTAWLNVALQAIVAIYNVAVPNAAGGRKRKSAKKSRKSAKKSLKSHKSHKKSRKHAKKSRKSRKH